MDFFFVIRCSVFIKVCSVLYHLFKNALKKNSVSGKLSLHILFIIIFNAEVALGHPT
jgi:hypothetical protein